MKEIIADATIWGVTKSLDTKKITSLTDCQINQIFKELIKIRTRRVEGLIKIGKRYIAITGTKIEE